MQVGKKNHTSSYNKYFFGVGRKKKNIFTRTCKLFSFVHRRKVVVVGLTKYDLIGNLVFNEMHGREEKILNHSLQAFFLVGEEKEKQTIFTLYMGKLLKNRKTITFITL